MTEQYRIQLYWPGRRQPVARYAQQLHAFLAALPALHPTLAGWLYDDRAVGVPASASSAAACERALTTGEVVWRTGTRERVSYERRFYLERRLASPWEVKLTCGIEPLGLDPMWVPNRLDVRVRSGVGDARASRGVLEGVLRAAIAQFEPEWGFAGTDVAPAAPLPLFSDGTPVVGWMLYLSAIFPALPPSVPPPAVAYSLDNGGRLVVAHPEPPAAHAHGQRDAVARLDRVLREAGVLVPPNEAAAR